MRAVKAYAATRPGGDLRPFEYVLGDLGADQVDIDIQSCGLCRSDLSMIDNSWQMTKFPLVPGHEIVGTVAAVGENVTHLPLGQTVGLGWMSRSCMVCEQCLKGDHNLCPTGEGTVIGRHGGFADRIRAQSTWVIPIPDGIDKSSAGPLFCAGITVFNPLIQHGVRPTGRVGVVGIGGLGHLAIKFLSAWGTEVTAFSSRDDKREEALEMGAHRAVDSTDKDEIKQLAGSLDLILVTANGALDWTTYLHALRPKGTLHFVGAAPKVSAEIFDLIGAQKSISGSPLGAPATMAKMLEFAARHDIAPTVERFGMSEVNDALEHLRSGKARYRVVLDNDF